MSLDVAGRAGAIATAAPAEVANILFRILRVHVPKGSRKPRQGLMLASLPVMLRHVSGPDLRVAAWYATERGRERSAILVDGGGRHYAPVLLRIGQALRLPEFLAILDDPERFHRLEIHGIGRAPTLPMEAEIESRSVQDDGMAPARALAAALSDALVLVDGIVHRRIDPPCDAIQFATFEAGWPYRIVRYLRQGLPPRTAALRLPPGTPTLPYEGALDAMGLRRSIPEPRRLLPGDVPPAFGHRELLEDVERALPWVICLQDVVTRTPDGIRAVAAFHRVLDGPLPHDPAAAVRILLEALGRLMDATPSPLGAPMLALYRARQEALR